MTKSMFALPLSIVVLSVSSLLATEQQPRSVPMPGGHSTSTQSDALSTNYRITFSGKSDDKSLGELSTLTCSKSLFISGPFNASDTPTTFSVSGTLEEKDGWIVFNYSIQFKVPVATISQPNTSPQPVGLGPVQYQDHASKGTLKVKPGKSYDLLKSGGNIYSIVVAPEIEK